MNIAHKQMEACGYISEIFELDSVYKQEVSFSPVVYSFFPERSDRERIVELMMVIIENYEERPHDCFQPNWQTYFPFHRFFSNLDLTGRNYWILRFFRFVNFK